MKLYILILSVLLLATSCYMPTSIRRVQKHADKLDGRKVRIKGEVVSSIQLEDLRLFYVASKNGKHNIAVVTKGSFPYKNDYTVVRGRVKNDFTHHGKYKMPVIYETAEIEKFKLKKRYKKKKSKYLLE